MFRRKCKCTVCILEAICLCSPQELVCTSVFCHQQQFEAFVPLKPVHSSSWLKSCWRHPTLMMLIALSLAQFPCQGTVLRLAETLWQHWVVFVLGLRNSFWGLNRLQSTSDLDSVRWAPKLLLHLLFQSVCFVCFFWWRPLIHFFRCPRRGEEENINERANVPPLPILK